MPVPHYYIEQCYVRYSRDTKNDDGSADQKGKFEKERKNTYDVVTDGDSVKITFCLQQ
jgi:hypothetical protein